jgi:precorrin-6Y C5,15-methyltransferase (decarboxylating)
VALLVSGDPGFFGLLRLARGRFGPAGLAVHPVPSAVALAFARVALPWDDAVVVSAHGRPLQPAVEAVLRHPKVAVLTSPEHPPEALGQGLMSAGSGAREVVVAARLGEPGESLWSGDLNGLAAGRFDALAVVICLAPGPRSDGGPEWAWGRPDGSYQHRAGLITKAEVRAVALGKLRLPSAGVVWDVGAGSGSVAAECARLAPGLRVFAVERRADDASRLRANLYGTAAVVVPGEAPHALAGLPDPDRAFVGGGGLAVLDAVLARLRPGGTVVATFAALDRAAAAAVRLGHVVQISVSRGVSIGPDGAVRLAAENPVFVCWGPEE